MMETIQFEIEAGPNNVILAWTLRWFPLPTPMENILANAEKHNASAIIPVMKTGEKDKLLNTSLLFEGMLHRVHSFTEIRSDIICSNYCQWGHITLSCRNADIPQCQICTRPQTTRNHK